MPRPTNEVRLLWRDAQPGVVHHKADLNGLQGKSNEGTTVVNLATAWEPHQELDGTPIVNVRQVAIDITNPTDAPQKLENIPLHELSDLHKRMQAERAEMVGELIVPVKISGLGVRMLLDTGASVSLISTYLWENLHAVDSRWILMPSEAKVRTVSGDLANVRGEIVLEVAIGQQYYVHQFLVMDIQEDVILGLDFVQRYQVDWNWGRGVLTLRGREAVAFKKYKLGDAKAKRIVARSRTLILASSMAVVNTKIQSQCVGALPDWGMVVPTKNPVHAMGAVAAATLVDPLADSIPVMIMTPTDSTIVLSPGQTLGVMVPVEHVSQPVTKFEGSMIEKTEVVFPKQGPEPHGPAYQQMRKVARLGNTEVMARESLTPSQMEYNEETTDVNDTGDIASSDHLAYEAQSIPQHLLSRTHRML